MFIDAVHYPNEIGSFHPTIGQNRLTHQPRCLQCKQADRDCVPRSRLCAAALSIYAPCFCADDCWCCIVSLPQLQGGRCCHVCFMCQIWALTLDPSSFSNAARQAGFGRGRSCITPGYFSLLVRASSASFLIVVPPLAHIFVAEGQHAA